MIKTKKKKEACNYPIACIISLVFKNLISFIFGYYMWFMLTTCAYVLYPQLIIGRLFSKKKILRKKGLRTPI